MNKYLIEKQQNIDSSLVELELTFNLEGLGGHPFLREVNQVSA